MQLICLIRRVAVGIRFSKPGPANLQEPWDNALSRFPACGII